VRPEFSQNWLDFSIVVLVFLLLTSDTLVSTASVAVFFAAFVGTGGVALACCELRADECSLRLLSKQGFSVALVDNVVSCCTIASFALECAYVAVRRSPVGCNCLEVYSEFLH
jgi:hypothetical protein